MVPGRFPDGNVTGCAVFFQNSYPRGLIRHMTPWQWYFADYFLPVLRRRDAIQAANLINSRRFHKCPSTNMNAAIAVASKRHCKNFQISLSKNAVIVPGAFINSFPTAAFTLKDLAGTWQITLKNHPAAQPQVARKKNPKQLTRNPHPGTQHLAVLPIRCNHKRQASGIISSSWKGPQGSSIGGTLQWIA